MQIRHNFKVVFFFAGMFFISTLVSYAEAFSHLQGRFKALRSECSNGRLIEDVKKQTISLEVIGKSWILTKFSKRDPFFECRFDEISRIVSSPRTSKATFYKLLVQEIDEREICKDSQGDHKVYQGDDGPAQPDEFGIELKGDILKVTMPESSAKETCGEDAVVTVFLRHGTKKH